MARRRRGRADRLRLLPPAPELVRDATRALVSPRGGRAAARAEAGAAGTVARVDQHYGARTRSAPPRLRPSGRAPLHREGDRSLEEGAYDRGRWKVIAPSSSAS